MENTTESIRGDALQRIIAEEVGAALAPLADKVLAEVAAFEKLKRRPLLTPLEVELVYGISPATLCTKRCRGGGPDYIKQDRSVWYRPQDIERWIDRNRRKGSYD